MLAGWLARLVSTLQSSGACRLVGMASLYLAVVRSYVNLCDKYTLQYHATLVYIVTATRKMLGCANQYLQCTVCRLHLFTCVCTCHLCLHMSPVSAHVTCVCTSPVSAHVTCVCTCHLCCTCSPLCCTCSPVLHMFSCVCTCSPVSAHVTCVYTCHLCLHMSSVLHLFTCVAHVHLCCTCSAVSAPVHLCLEWCYCGCKPEKGINTETPHSFGFTGPVSSDVSTNPITYSNYSPTSCNDPSIVAMVIHHGDPS